MLIDLLGVCTVLFYYVYILLITHGGICVVKRIDAPVKLF